MATITSAQNGWWEDPGTWVGGNVPELFADDVMIASGHTVQIESWSNFVVGDGLNLTVDSGGTLVIHGTLDAYYYGSIHVKGDLLVLLGGFVNLYDFGSASVYADALVTLEGDWVMDYYINLNLYGEFAIEQTGSFDAMNDCAVYISSGAFDIHGYFAINEPGSIDLNGGTLTVYSNGVADIDHHITCIDSLIEVYGDLAVTSYGQVEIDNASVFTCESSGLLHCDGDVAVTNDSSCVVHGLVVLSRDVHFEVDEGGSLVIDFEGLLSDFGHLYIKDAGQLYVDGEIRVYKDIYTSGRMYGGGRIVMLRRDGRIRDGDGHNLFQLDQAYGYAQSQLA